MTTSQDRARAMTTSLDRTAVTTDADVVTRMARLRHEFDHSFAEPVRRHDEEHVELLAIRAGGHPYALRLAQTQGLHPDRPVTPLPGSVPSLLGLAGFAGTVVPVYDLAALLGHPVAGRPRWLVLPLGTPPLGLAFHELDGHVRVAADAIVAEDAAAGRRGCLRGMVGLDGLARPLVDVPATRAVVHALAGHTIEAGHTTEEVAR
ncbi:chemotaxis protein CheW [Paractinoplanes rhizophilus]|uniref:Chemotaxis protein CheW n=1 Tax=Paractinoplanes rhizophilus TaxID=1416877 RepID=A0ABW2HVK5_9ACTN|nr:chemotaxis protein CheW [Actinoplanes sp.]